MRLEKLTEKAQEALQEAADLARTLGQQAIEPALVSVVERLPKVTGAGQPYLSTALQKALDQAEQEADRLKDEYISTEHLVLALAEHVALKDAGARHDALLK